MMVPAPDLQAIPAVSALPRRKTEFQGLQPWTEYFQ